MTFCEVQDVLMAECSMYKNEYQNIPVFRFVLVLTQHSSKYGKPWRENMPVSTHSA